jgi:hypothetical protein
MKQRAALKAGRTPWWLIRRPKHMQTRDFERRKALLERNEKALKTKYRAYLLENMKMDRNS